MADPDEVDGDDDGDDDEDEESPDLLVGYFGDAVAEDQRHLFTRHFFPSKVGGRAAWLIPKGIPSRAEGGCLQCCKCGSPLRFLLQVYASRGDELAEAFHRTVYVFVCTSCQPNEVRVFRAQLPQANEFYGPEPIDTESFEGDPAQAFVKDALVEAECCRQCHLPPKPEADAMCPECKRLAKFSERPALFPEHAIDVDGAVVPDPEAEEDAEEDAAKDGTSISSETKKTVEEKGDEEVEDDDDEEEVPPLPESASKTGDAEMDAKIREYKERIANDPSFKLDKSEQKVFEEFSKGRTVKDSYFSAFQKFSAQNPGHVLRYEFGGEPMWFCKPRQFTEEPPHCPLCQAPRVFEFQVQPQLISLLSHAVLGKRLDFGTIVVYACKQSCSSPDAGATPYIEEFAYVQPEPTDEWQLPPV
mmetsp:Transcript_22886/g.53563  ORF Transcript_22886/g.53563 Transcript_22886/m.53563 type:complete len:416 (+) Transcript_22886:43-1290(+)